MKVSDDQVRQIANSMEVKFKELCRQRMMAQELWEQMTRHVIERLQLSERSE